ncbi:MAG: LysR family transcriptional regulator, partial [Ilumatobacteraceae bacterium]|nr:LysR family transcriptional regulator [Ilumatobacteraceae bacterium]
MASSDQSCRHHRSRSRPTLGVVDIRLLRTFTTVVRLGSFTGAADSLGYTQSAVSQHIAALETSLGITLFQRRPFAVTPAAQRLAEHANNILLRLDVATSEVAAIAARSITALATTPMAASTPEVARLLTLARR